MGVADLVPGISGGTMAFILGVYEPLLQSIGSFRPKHLTDFIFGRWITILKEVKALFLFPLLLGMAAAIFSLSRVFHLLLSNPSSRSVLFSAFLGLVVASAYFVAKKINRWSRQDVAALLIGVVLALIVVLVPAGQAYLPRSGLDLPLIFYGALASSAMLLPGISGSYILTILGVYPFCMAAIMEVNIPFLGQLMAGILLGALLFSRCIAFLLKHYHSLTLALLTGFMLGSLPAVWPFFQIIPDFQQATTWLYLGVALAAFLVVIAIEQISLYTSKKRVI